MRELLKKVTPVFIKRAVHRVLQRRPAYFAIRSFSQEGEDMVLRRLFEGQAHGFYVDVGAHHPWRFSNTYFFYKRGWRGINIDATAESIAKFHHTRRRDINVEAAVSSDGRELILRLFNEPALNSLQPGQNENVSEMFHVVSERKIKTRRLADILSENLPAGQRIDFLSVDVEGMDLEVLQSNDWQQYRPRYVLSECFGQNAGEVASGPISAFLGEQGYEFLAKTVHTAIFRDRAERSADAGGVSHG
jgi:FkbM family methyltransferase